MALQSFNFNPGINKEETDLANSGGWVDSNLIRFRKSRVEKIGGWINSSENTYLGTSRALHEWLSLGGTRLLGIGSELKYYINTGGSFFDITPIRLTTGAGDVTFAATNGSSTIVVSDTSHGAVANDSVTFSGATTLGGNITASVLNQEYQIDKIVDANSYNITAKDSSGATVTANASDTANGGSSTVGTYQINVGLNDYVQTTGWGIGLWGASSYGSVTVLDATNQLRTWTHDNFGENLIINARGAGIFEWIENDGTSTRAVELSGRTGANLVPTVGLGVIVSEVDRHLIVLGADPISGGSRTGVIDPMLVAFSDQENELDFEPTLQNTAGSLRLSAGSQIIGATKSRQEILIWTDTSLYSMQFIGPPLVFGMNLVNENTGLVGPKAAITAPSGVFFMDKNSFYVYNGSVQKLPCTVQDFVFSDLDLTQAFKVHAGLNAEFGEVWFFYPSIEDGTREVSRYVIYNYQENLWSVGKLVRYAWLDAGIENTPQATATANGSSVLYNHESGFNDDTNPMTDVFVESADLEIGNGESFTFIKRVLPDISFTGNANNSPGVNIVLKTRDFSNQTLTTNSTSQITPTSKQAFVRSRGRQFVLRFETDDDNTGDNQKDFKFRLGNTRLDLIQSGRR
tara:strand:+ start:4466 stop:6355 length:1890 start_codon:yes stop_codon:yes gene_type:complete